MMKNKREVVLHDGGDRFTKHRSFDGLMTFEMQGIVRFSRDFACLPFDPNFTCFDTIITWFEEDVGPGDVRRNDELSILISKEY
jgi:hypothetical protein